METTAATEVIEAAQQIDYSATLNQILASTQNAEYALQILAGFGLFAVVVCLCYFSYKFFRIFF